MTPAERRSIILSLRAAGCTYREIAKEARCCAAYAQQFFIAQQIKDRRKAERAEILSREMALTAEDRSVAPFPISGRLRNVCLNADIVTIGDLAEAINMGEMRRLPCVGRVTLQEARRLVSEVFAQPCQTTPRP